MIPLILFVTRVMGHAQVLTNTHITNTPLQKLPHKASALVFVLHPVVCARSSGPNDTGACPTARDVSIDKAQ